MSQLLDSLRRASQPPPARGRQPPTRPSAEAVLATMGYSRARRGDGVSVAVLVAAAVVLAGLGVRFQLSESPPASAPTIALRDVTNDSPRASIRASGPVRPRASAADRPDPARTADNRNPSPPRVSARPARKKQDLTPAFERALELQRTGQLEAAARAYQPLLAETDVAAAAHNNLGLLYQQQGDLDQAVRHLGRALEGNPLYVNAHNNLGVVLLAQGRVDAAARHFRRAAELAPGDPDALVNLALAEKAAGRTEQARESLLRALGLAPDNAAAHYNLAVLYDRSGQVRRAVEHYRAFLDQARAEHAARAADVRARLDALDRLR